MPKPSATPSYHITDADSQDYGSNFGYTQEGPGTLIMDADAFLVTDLFIAMDLGGGPWTVTINGMVTAPDSAAVEIGVDSNDFSFASVTFGATAEISGAIGVELGFGDLTNKGEIIATDSGRGAIEVGGGDATIKNSGTISSAGDGIQFGIQSGGTHTILNSGSIQAPLVIDSEDSAVNIEHVTNSGLMDGAVNLGGGGDSFTDFGTVKVGGKTVTHQGTVTGLIDLGDGDDHFTGGNNAETVTDGNGSDVYKLGGGNDIFIATGATGSDGTDTVDGGTGVDLYDASAATGAITVNLDTKVHGAIAASSASVNGATDKVTNFEDVNGGSGDDTIYGNASANHINGGDGEDTIYGFAGNDVLNGGFDDDNLYGGAGRDIMTGGDGGSGPSGGGAGSAASDTFHYLALSDSGVTAATRDEITDFDAGGSTGDIIDLSAIDAIPKTTAHDEFHFIGESKWDGVAGELRYVYTATQTIIEADVNGDKKMDFSIALDGHHTLAADNFLGVI